MALKTVRMQQWIVLLATVFVVAGVVAVIKLRPGGAPADEPIQASDAAVTGRVVLFEEEGRAHIVDPDTGTELRECTVDGATRIIDVTQEGIAIAIPTGERIRIGFDCVAKGDVFPPAAIVTEEDEVEFADGTTVALVAENGRPFREAQIVGWMDSAHVALVAFRGDTRVALAAGTDGTLRTLATLPEFVGGFAAGGGAFWYVSASPGPGIEFGPSGPSAIHRVALDGTQSERARNETNVLEGLSVSPQGAFAYVDDGALWMGEGERVVNSGMGIPAGWSDDNRALVVDAQGRLSFRTGNGEVTETSVVLPSGVVQVWSVDVGAAME